MCKQLKQAKNNKKINKLKKRLEIYENHALKKTSYNAFKHIELVRNSKRVFKHQ